MNDYKLVTNIRRLITFGMLLCSIGAWGQCIVINELMINAAGPNDGQNSPNTAEWVELYNTCSTPVDIGCYAFTDGDFTVVIPPGTIIQPYSYYTIGSANSGFVPDLSWATCGCTTEAFADQVGIFTNGNEQLILHNSTGQLVDAIVWGSGQFGVNISTTTATGCSLNTFNYPSSNNSFEDIGAGGQDGCGKARACDGSATWVEVCGNQITPGVSNSGETPSIQFTASATAICEGDCVNFSYTGSGNPSQYSWTFQGSSTSSSISAAPFGVCYSAAGGYDVTLSVTNSCGTFSSTVEDYIHVSQLVDVSITANGPTTFCAGGSVTLQTSSSGPYQWYVDGNEIPGATSQSYSTNQAGDYSLEITSNCGNVSNVISVEIANNLEPLISANGPTNLCTGESTVLTANGNYDSYQWYSGSNQIAGATSSTYTASAAGVYSVFVTGPGGCNGSSDAITVSLTNITAPTILDELTACEGSVVEINGTNNADSFEWFVNGVLLDVTNNFSYEYTVHNGDVVSVNALSNGCEAESNDMQIIGTPLPQVSVQPAGAVSVCLDSYILNAQSLDAGSYQWWTLQSGTPHPISGETSSSCTVNADGQYWVVLTSADGCEGVSNVVTVDFTSELAVSIVSPSTGICEGQSLTLSVNGSYESFLWSTGETTAQIQISTPGIYSVVVENTGCSANDDITIGFVPLSVEIQSSSDEACEGDVIELSVTGGYNSILWSNGSTANSISVSSNGVFGVTVNSNGCVAVDDILLMFHPIPFVDAGENKTSDCDIGAVLEGSGDGVLEWLPHPDLMQTDDPVTAIANPARTSYFTLRATDNGCIAEDKVLVEVDCSSVYVPNSFTPNGDGINDVFRIITRGAQHYRLEIFNRWGELVFESSNPEEVWVGGKGDYFVPDGTYFWKLDVRDSLNNPMLDYEHNHGHVTIIR